MSLHIEKVLYCMYVIKREKSFDYLLITYMKKINCRLVTGSKGSSLLCWMFGDSLENLGKALESAKNKHSNKFRNF